MPQVHDERACSDGHHSWGKDLSALAAYRVRANTEMAEAETTVSDSPAILSVNPTITGTCISPQEEQ